MSAAANSKRYALSAVDKQRQQLDRLLKDPSKPIYVPPPPQEKFIRPAREMMKNVQGSSAGAGSGEFHVYKAGRRREYERLAILAEQSQKEIDEREFEQRRQEAAAIADSKTTKNRNKRQKRKERTKGSSKVQNDDETPLKKRRLVNGEAIQFRRPGEDSDTEDETPIQPPPSVVVEVREEIAVVEGAKITIVEDD
ncbi:DUF1168-domain-containing protein [Hymenopellis radicata]|nr:DUF1168-domain-containing protein [Hymenopellis radicata]